MKHLSIALLLTALSPQIVFAIPEQKSSNQKVQQIYQPKDFSYLLGMPGFTDNALNMHFKLYQGYVTNTNLLLSILQQYVDEGKDRTPQYAEIKRRLGWEFDGMRLHEYYFSNLGGKGTHFDSESALGARIAKDFGSFDTWKQDFVSTGAMRGIGWAVLYFDRIQGRLINTWVGEHDLGNLAGAEPIIVMDVWEHAYMPDYGLDRADYIKAFFENLNWNIANKRFSKQSS